MHSFVTGVRSCYGGSDRVISALQKFYRELIPLLKDAILATMKLVLFDIDGTILDSVQEDDRCFIQTFHDLYQIDLMNSDWNDFKHVTDAGLTQEIFEKWLGRLPKKEEVDRVRLHFKNLLADVADQFMEIENSLSFIAFIADQPHIEVGFATGGWKETAELKCNAIGLNLNNFIFKSSNDHFNRATIIEKVIEVAKNKHNTDQFDSITYFGDGMWDFNTTKALNIDFIGVDYANNGKLRNVGVEKIIQNYAEKGDILNWINGEEFSQK